MSADHQKIADAMESMPALARAKALMCEDHFRSMLQSLGEEARLGLLLVAFDLIENPPPVTTP